MGRLLLVYLSGDDIDAKAPRAFCRENRQGDIFHSLVRDTHKSQIGERVVNKVVVYPYHDDSGAR